MKGAVWVKKAAESGSQKKRVLDKKEKKMAEKVLKAGITRKPGWLYYLDRNLDVYRAKMVRGGEKKR